MLLSYLFTFPECRAVLFDGSGQIPNILTIQEVLEYAWKCGFDSGGAAQLGYKVKGTGKWIGTSEVAVLLSYFKLRVGIYEFKKSSQQNEDIISWVINYFLKNRDRQFLPPLYLQFAGHSVTIVGVEIGSRGTTHFIVFDPAKSGNYVQSEITQGRFNLVRIPISRFISNEYQIVTIKDPALLNSKEWENSKSLQRDL